MPSSFVDPSTLRAQLAQRMGELYRREVPRFAQLLEIVETTNADTLRARGDERCEDAAYVAALSAQRHGAIRVGSPSELAVLARLFAQYAMEPVGFYDLVPAGLPVYSTAFRPVTTDGLAASPFRVFCSLLRPELIDDAAVREKLGSALATRRIVAARLEALIDGAEARGGVEEEEAEEFLSLSVDVFRWSGRARVDRETYSRFAASHRLIADVAAFPGPHINHLTPSALDIDAVQARMVAAGIGAKTVIEGPPPRRWPILLRQTAFNAVEEEVAFPAEDGRVELGSHTARFGEVEQRGAALTPAGRELYDACLAEAQASCAPGDGRDPALYGDALREAFQRFPDDWDTLVERELVYCRFLAADDAGAGSFTQGDTSDPLAAVRAGRLRAEPILYEDFLPVSAAGIFRSNLGDEGRDAEAGGLVSSQAAFEAALRRSVIDPHALYRLEQAESLRKLAS